MTDSRRVSSICLVVFIFVLFLLITPPAWGKNSQVVNSTFSESGLSSLFQSTDFSHAEFVMYDCSTSTQKYLKVRSSYESRYKSVVGNDGVSILGESGEPRLPLDGHELVEVDDPSASLFCNVLRVDMCFDGEEYCGSSFMVSDCLAATAAHCIYDFGGFADSTPFVRSAKNNKGMYQASSKVKYAIVPIEWAESSDCEQDYALLVLKRNPVGTDASSYFSYESITVLQSLGLKINDLGFTALDGDSYVKMYTNASAGWISTQDPKPLGNAFRIELSSNYGMSGGPIYAVVKGEPLVIGMVSHNNGDASSPMNFACRVTERLQVIIAWAQAKGYKNTSAGTSGSTSPSTGGSAYEFLLSRGVAARRFVVVA